MTHNKSKIFPFLITIIIIVIVIYLFANLEQTSISCSRKTTDDLGITIIENLETTLDGRNIDRLNLSKTIVLPEKYTKNDKYIDYIAYAIEKSYDYIGSDKVEINKLVDRVIVNIDVSDDETLILNNIQFRDEDALSILINSNTKSSDVVTLKINDDYTQGELITRMKNKGYQCE